MKGVTEQLSSQLSPARHQRPATSGRSTVGAAIVPQPPPGRRRLLSTRERILLARRPFHDGRGAARWLRRPRRPDPLGLRRGQRPVHPDQLQTLTQWEKPRNRTRRVPQRPFARLLSTASPWLRPIDRCPADPNPGRVSRIASTRCAEPSERRDLEPTWITRRLAKRVGKRTLLCVVQDALTFRSKTSRLADWFLRVPATHF
jgi:hypothetical protein